MGGLGGQASKVNIMTYPGRPGAKKCASVPNPGTQSHQWRMGKSVRMRLSITRLPPSRDHRHLLGAVVLAIPPLIRPPALVQTCSAKIASVCVCSDVLW
jgi:hypothetical protein